MATSLVAIASLAAAETPQKVNPAAYPELAPEALLPAIIQDLKRTIDDPYSIRDFLLCPAEKLRFKNGKLTSWTVSFAFNAKNATGGYTGLTPYFVGFRGGVIKLHAFTSRLPGDDGLNGLINRGAVNRVLRCASVPDAQIQELLSRPMNVAPQ